MMRQTFDITDIDPALVAYEQMAEFYDDFTAADDYERWSQMLVGLIERYGGSFNRVLDVATGTGKIAAAFARLGADVTACDISPAMVTKAAARDDLAQARLFVADMRKLPEVRAVDAVMCIDDAVNYLLTDADLLAAFRSVSRLLAPGGLYLFDVNCLLTYRTAFAATSAGEHNGLFLVWSGRGQSSMDAGDEATAEITCFTPLKDQTWRRVSTLHRQRHHDQDTLRALLVTAGLEVVGVHGLHPTGVLDDTLDDLAHTKAIYIARKAPTAPDHKRR